MPAMQTVTDLIEDWRPEVLLLVGIAGGIVRTTAGGSKVEGPSAGDVVCIEFVHYADYSKRSEGKRHARYFPVQHPDTNLISAHMGPIHQAPWFDQLPAERPGEGHPRLHFGEVVAVEFLAGDGAATAQQEALGPYDHALGVDMESAGVARAMHTASRSVHYRPVWLGFRGISDRTAATSEAMEALERGGDEAQGNDEERQAWRPYAAAAAARVAHLTAQRLLRVGRVKSSDPGAPKWSHPTKPASETGERIGQ